MPQNDVNSKLAEAKKTLANLKLIPSTPPPAQSKPAGDYSNAPYSMAKEARDTGKSINYNLKQKQVANQAIADETK